MSAAATIGVDVGGTKIAAGLLHGLTPLLEREIPTNPGRGGQSVLDDVLALVTALNDEARHAGLTVTGIGIGVPELVTPDGQITSRYSFDWCNLPISSCFSGIAPCIVESDMRAAARAEAMIGAGKAYRQFAYISVGTGIGYSLVLDGVPFAGARGNALLLGSGTLSSVCPVCGAQHGQILEDFAAGPAMVRNYNQRTNRQLGNAHELFSALEHGDSDAAQVIENAADSLGNSVGFLINLLDPEAIIVGGGLGVRDGLYWERFIASTRAHIWADSTRELPILHAQTGRAAGWIGAAMCAVKI